MELTAFVVDTIGGDRNPVIQTHRSTHDKHTDSEPEVVIVLCGIEIEVFLIQESPIVEGHKLELLRQLELILQGQEPVSIAASGNVPIYGFWTNFAILKSTEIFRSTKVIAVGCVT